MLLVTAILQSQRKAKGGKNKKALVDLFKKASDAPQVAIGLQYFLAKVVANSDLAGSEAEQRLVKWGCGVASDVLADIASTATAKEGSD